MLDVLDMLKVHGLAIVSGPELLGHGVCKLLDDYLFKFRAMPEVAALQSAFERGEQRADVLKPHMVKTDQVGCGTLMLQQLGEEPPIRDVVRDYLGTPKQVARNGWYFFPRPYERQRIWSENWHRDPEAGYGQLVKTFYWPEHVDAESGPMQYIPASRHGGPLESLCAPKSYPDCDVDAIVHPDCVVTCEVPAQTFMFVDTSGLHRGGYTKSKGRLCATWCFVSGEK